MKNEYRYFFKSNFVEVNRLFVLVYSNKITILKYLKLEDITYQNELLILIMSSSIEKALITIPLILI